MMRVQTASRLHFGLLSIPSEPPRTRGTQKEEAACLGLGRSWGGIGLMIRRPGIDLRAEPANQFEAAGPLRERVLVFCKRFLNSLSESERTDRVFPLQFSVNEYSAEHQGLGTGTQLGLAVARIMAEAYDLPDRSALELALRIGRGRRSAIGIHGFDQGGFIVEAGKRPDERIAPLITRLHFPDAWRVLVITRTGRSGIHGIQESNAFEEMQRQTRKDEDIRGLCRLLLMGVLPELVRGDLAAFGEALYEYNRRVGMSFRRFQGGIYSHPLGEELADWFRRQKVQAVGQSSWGPAMFAIVEDEERARELTRRIHARFHLAKDDLLVTECANMGAEFSVLPK